LGKQAKVLALSRWLEIDSLSIQRSNVSNDNTYGEAYLRFEADVQALNWVFGKAEDTRLTRHFYSEHERDAVVLYWARRANQY